LKWFKKVAASKILDRLYLGNVYDAAALFYDNPHKITAVLNVSTEAPYEHNPDIIYRDIPFDDGHEIPADKFADCMAFLKYCWKHDRTTLVHCLSGEMMVNAHLPFRADSLTQGTNAYDFKGDTRSITHYLNRSYSGELLTFTMGGNLPFRCTPEHPLLIIRPYRNSSGKIFKPNWVVKETKNHPVIPVWIRASEVEVGDLLLCPAPQLPTSGSKPELIVAEHWNAKQIDTIQPNADLAWFMGLYIADGSTCGEYVIQLTLNEKSERQRLDYVIKQFGVEAAIEEHPNYFRFKVNSKTLASSFKEWFGADSYSKRIPEFLFSWGDGCIQALLDGVIEGDGDIDRGGRNTSPRLITTSQRLAYQVWHFLIKLGRYPYISEFENGRVTNFGERAPTWRVWWSEGGKHHKTCYHGGYYCMPVTGVSSEDYTGLVYNYSIEETESFIANGVVTHNCAAGISRSSSITISFLYFMGLVPPLVGEASTKIGNTGFDKGHEFVTLCRPIIDPAHRTIGSCRKWLRLWPHDGSMGPVEPPFRLANRVEAAYQRYIEQYEEE
jgi:hypothetical protein